jgi:hypothetical protein
LVLRALFEIRANVTDIHDALIGDEDDEEEEEDF